MQALRTAPMVDSNMEWGGWPTNLSLHNLVSFTLRGTRAECDLHGTWSTNNLYVGVVYSKTQSSKAEAYWTIPSGNQLKEYKSVRYVTGLSPDQRKLTERSLFPHSRPSRSHGRCCGQQQGSSHHGSCLRYDSIFLSEGKAWLRLTDRRLEGVCCTKHSTTSFDCIEPFPYHAHDWAGSHILDQTREERFALQVSVVCIITSNNVVTPLTMGYRQWLLTLFEVLFSRVDKL